MVGVEVFNLQGLGSRTEQQDAFGISPLASYETQGLFAVLCDGMGGMAEGASIAQDTVAAFLSAVPWADDAEALRLIDAQTKRVYARFFGQGGTTLVLVKLFRGKLRFWSVGDSDLFLYREGRLTALNERQEFRNRLLRRAMDGLLSIGEAYGDPQAAALDTYIGQEKAPPDYLRSAFSLKKDDRLLLCSDGVSDTLTLRQMGESLALDTPEETCACLESMISEAQAVNQDNYTAIVLKYNGGGNEE